MRHARFEYQTREDAMAIVRRVAALLRDSKNAEFVLLELMVNAVEHGNLEIGGARKLELVRRGELDAEIDRRHAEPPYRDRVAWLEVVCDDHHATFAIGDEGPGFDHARVGTASACPGADAPCGRGLALARQLCASALAFNDTGNIVTVSWQW